MSAVIARSAAATLDRYRAAFDALPVAQDDLGAVRREALERFLAAGFPNQRHEDWKYTNLRRLENRTFTPAPRSPAAVASADWIDGAGTRIDRHRREIDGLLDASPARHARVRPPVIPVAGRQVDRACRGAFV